MPPGGGNLRGFSQTDFGSQEVSFWPLAVHQLKCSDVGFRAESGTR